ncbi:MAG TPA: polysaccharide biosynthesis/export family protein [Bryobacteraceae bacterium]|nr:polysaccharide biosynthesis/export family protein [Bryobacteraceae bacterium]
MGPMLGNASKYRGLLAAFVLIGFAAGWGVAARAQSAAPADPVMPEGYRIGAGDVLEIMVWKEPEASVGGVEVRADGKITVPLIGEVAASGLTPTELTKILVDKFSQYILNGPTVTVVTKEINSRRIYVLGKVKKEGPLALLRPMTVLQALDEAGGLADFASKTKIYVLRNVKGKQTKMPFDYKAVVKGQRLEQNVTLLPDDTIVVP